MWSSLCYDTYIVLAIVEWVIRCISRFLQKKPVCFHSFFLISSTGGSLFVCFVEIPKWSLSGLPSWTKYFTFLGGSGEDVRDETLGAGEAHMLRVCFVRCAMITYNSLSSLAKTSVSPGNIVQPTLYSFQCHPTLNMSDHGNTVSVTWHAFFYFNIQHIEFWNTLTLYSPYHPAFFAPHSLFVSTAW